MAEAERDTGRNDIARAREIPEDRERDLRANERAFRLAVAEIPNPGPIDEPLVELQAFHAEQTDPPPGPYPDPPRGPYPDPVIKERPSEEAVYGNTQSRTRSARSTDDHATRREPVTAERAGSGRPATDRAGDQARQR